MLNCVRDEVEGINLHIEQKRRPLEGEKHNHDRSIKSPFLHFRLNIPVLHLRVNKQDNFI